MKRYIKSDISTDNSKISDAYVVGMKKSLDEYIDNVVASIPSLDDAVVSITEYRTSINSSDRKRIRDELESAKSKLITKLSDKFDAVSKKFM